MKKQLAKVVNQFLRIIGAKIVPTFNTTAEWEDRIAHAKSIGFLPRQIVDAGAYIGSWSLSIAKIFPDSQIIAIEPNPYIQQKLQKNLSSITPEPIIIQKAVAEKSDTTTFNIWGNPKKATSASLQTHVMGDADNKIDVSVETLDNIAKLYNFRPNLIKLDLQGSEIRALKGASTLLSYTEMFMVEFGCFEAYVGRATPGQLFEVFYKNNFSLYDIVDLHLRPYDGALAGGDFVFVKNNSSLLKYKNWR